MVTELASTAATTAALQAANAAKTALNAKKPGSATSASLSTNNINSIFDKAKQAVESAKQQGQSITDSAGQEINITATEVVSKSQENQQQLASVIEANTQAFNDYLQTVAELNEQKKTIEDKIKEKGGEVQEDSSSQSETQAAEATQGQINFSEAPKTDKDGNVQQTPQTRTQKLEQKVSKKQEQQTDDPELQQLQNQLGEVKGQISDAGASFLQTSAQNAAKGTEVVAKNTADVVAGETKINTTNAKANVDLAAVSTKLDVDTGVAKVGLNTEVTSQTTQKGLNTASSATAKTAATAARTAAAAADPRDTNKEQLEQVATELDGLSTDFGSQSGFAKTNQDNITNANKYSTEITNLVSNFKSTDYAQFTKGLNDIYAQAMQDVAKSKTLVGAENISAGGKVDGGDSSDDGSTNSTTTNPIDSKNGKKKDKDDNGAAVGMVISGVQSTLQNIFGK